MNSKTIHLIKVLIVLFLIALTTCLVCITGGTYRAFTHFMYIPIILSSHFFGVKGTIASALLGGLALGPFMPQSVNYQLMQDPINWIFRTLLFSIIGIFTSLLFNRIKDYRKAEIESSYIHLLTGFPNVNKLQVDLDELIDRRNNFSLIGFKLGNIKNIRQNISNEISIKTIKKVMNMLSNMSDANVYSEYDDHFFVLLPEKNIKEAQILGEAFLDKTLEPIIIDGLRIGLLIKGGVVNYPLHGEKPYDLIKKIGMVLDEKNSEIGLDIYDVILEDKSKKQTEMVTSLMQAIRNDELFLVYQPKVGISGDNSMSVEALIRWNHPTRGLVSPALFINIAEETGLIGEITKWVIKNAIQQKEKWKKAGMPIKISINISYKDLNNNSVLEYFIEMAKDKELDLSLFELELTERDIPMNMEAIIPIFNSIRESGIKLALDDFGTGYTTIESLYRLPMDYIKIDKSLIDHIRDPTYRLSIEYIIEIAHSIGRKVIAEGVEHKEQLDILKDLKCDYIQGYYLSKPLPADDIIDFYNSPNN